MRPFFDDPPSLEDKDAVDQTHARQVMRDDQGGGSLGGPLQRAHDGLLRGRVQAGRRLIQN